MTGLFESIWMPETLGPLLIDGGGKGLALVVMAIALVAGLRRAPAAWRHLVWSLTVAGLLGVPLLSYTLPAWQIPVPHDWIAVVQGDVQTLAQPLETPHMESSSTAAGQGDSKSVLNAPSSMQHSAPTAPAETANAATGALPLAGSFASATNDTPAEPIAPSWMAWISIVWMFGALIAMLIPVTGLWRVARLRRSATTVGDDSWLRLLETHCNDLKLRRTVRLLKSPQTRMPLTWGALRPVLLLPEEACEWPESRRTMVLLHELAHIKRLDWLAQMGGQVACALHWFNPLVWFVGRSMQVEREQACDDMVLCAGTSATDYAAELLHFASRLQHRASLAAALPMARQSSIELRVRGILEPGRRRATMTRTSVLAGLVGCGLVLVPLAMLHAVPAKPAAEARYPSQVGTGELSAFSVVNADSVEYAFLYVGTLESTTQFTRNSKTHAFSDIATLSFDDMQLAFHRNHVMPDRLTIGGIPYAFTAGRVFIIDTITPQPDAPWQIRQIDADIPVITLENIERVFEIAHQPGFLSESTVGFTGEFPKGSKQKRTIEMYSRHDGYRTRFALFHSTDDVAYDNADSNDPLDGSWRIDNTLQLDDARNYRLRCSSDAADSLRINTQEFELKEGRVIVVNDDGTLTQHAEFPRVIRNPAEMLRLFARITPAVPKQGESAVPVEPEPSVASTDRVSTDIAATEDRKFVPIDLEDKATKRLADMNLLRLWRGEHIFHGVKFNVGRGVVQLGSKMFPEKPDMVVNINIDEHLAKLHFLHATGWGGGPSLPGTETHVEDGTRIGEYKINYKDKTVETIPIVYGEDVCDWFFREGEEPPTRSKVAWTGNNIGALRYRCRVRLYLSTWENPKPESKIVSIDYIGRKDQSVAAPFCIAMSLEQE